LTTDNTRTGPTRLAKYSQWPQQRKKEKEKKKEKKQQLLSLWMCSDTIYYRLE